MLNIPVFSDSDNETKVRESFVIPLLSELGFTDDEISPEYPLNINLQGKTTRLRADYLISVNHKFDLPPNKIIIEVKRPSISLNDANVLEQARLYSNHREVRAIYIVLTNGREVVLYQPIGSDLSMVGKFVSGDLPAHWERLKQIIGAETLKSYFAGMNLIEKIGSGGFGSVYKGRNVKLKRVEAIKILHSGSEQVESILRRFERGAQALAVFDHPYICRVLDINAEHGRLYYRMDLVDGTSVTDYVRNLDLDIHGKISLFSKICEALLHAHQNNVIHCDLKPSNVMVEKNGNPKIIDFDFCHLGTGASTILSQIVATIAYMDPTIWKDPANRDELADVYSSGLLLWSILTGEDLMPGWTSHFLLNKLSNQNSETEKYGHIVLRCIQENRNHRPQNIDSLKKLLNITDWHKTFHDEITGVGSTFSSSSPALEFEYRCKLWQQTNSLPGDVDFDRITKGIPDRTLTLQEQEFIFRSACSHWSTKYRHIFQKWQTSELLVAAVKILNDRSLDSANRGKKAETHPIHKMMEILISTDEYRSKEESESVAGFFLDSIYNEKIKRQLFFTALDFLSRLKCFDSANVKLRSESSKILIELARIRSSQNGIQPIKQIQKILGKLDPHKCGHDSPEVINFIRDLARKPELFDKAIQILGLFQNAAVSDAFIAIMEEIDITRIEKVALVATGAESRHKRPAVAKYLTELPDFPKFISSKKLIAVINELSR